MLIDIELINCDRFADDEQLPKVFFYFQKIETGLQVWFFGMSAARAALYIGGQLVVPTLGAYSEVINPSTEEVCRDQSPPLNWLFCRSRISLAAVTRIE